MEISELEFKLLKNYLISACGIDIPWEKRYLFVTRLGALLSELNCKSFSQFYGVIAKKSNDELKGRLVEAMTTNETSFFRDRHPFDTFRKVILPKIAQSKKNGTIPMGGRIRVWSVGCSTGEEPYSIAISIADWLKNKTNFDWTEIQVIGVDISKSAIRHARKAIYHKSRIEKHIPYSYLEEYFELTSEGWKVSEHIRRMVSFSEINLNEPMEQFGVFDVIFCRNVMIYFSPEGKKKILQSFYKMLNENGVLIMGASETIFDFPEKFKGMHSGPTTYYMKQV